MMNAVFLAVGCLSTLALSSFVSAPPNQCASGDNPEFQELDRLMQQLREQLGPSPKDTAKFDEEAKFQFCTTLDSSRGCPTPQEFGNGIHQQGFTPSLLAMVASYAMTREEAQNLFMHWGMSDEEIREITRNQQTFPPTRWSKFDDKDNRNITLSNDNTTAANDWGGSQCSLSPEGMCAVRAVGWVPRENSATATVRLDRVGSDSDVYICVLEKNCRRFSINEMIDSPSAWCYSTADGKVYLADKQVQCSERDWRDGSEITVTLRNGTVTWLAKGGEELYSFTLPEDCGDISLAVYASDIGSSDVNVVDVGTTVTLL